MATDERAVSEEPEANVTLNRDGHGWVTSISFHGETFYPAEPAESEPVAWQVTCEDGHVGYFPSVYTTLCDFASGNDPMPDDGEEPEDRCLKKRVAVPLYTHPAEPKHA